MNTKGTKFLAVLAVLTMAFAGFAVISEVQTSDAASIIELAGDNRSGEGYDYVADTKTLTLTADIAAGLMFTGTDILAGEGTTADMMAAHGFVVKKTIGAVTTYSSSVSGAFSTIVNDKATAAAATAAPVSVVLLTDADEENGIIMSGVDVTTKYVAVNFDLNGKTLSHTGAGGLVGVSSVNKFIYVNDNQILKITNGTIKSELEYANIATKDVAFALIQTYGPLTLGDGNSALTLDISGVKTEAPAGDAPQNLAVGVLYTSATSVVNANVTIDAGKNVALYAVYGASNNAGWYQTANGGTDTKENSTTGVKVTVKNGATINGEIGAVYYTAGGDYGLNTITTGADLTIDGGTFSGKVVENLPIYNAGDVVPSIAASEGAVKTKVSIAGGSFTDFSALNYFTANSTAKIVSGDKEIPKPTTEPVVIDNPDASGTDIPESGTVICNVNQNITALPTAAITADVVFQAGTANNVAFSTLTVKDNGSVTFTNMNSVTGIVKTTDGTSTQSFELDGFKGTLTVTKGSIIINAQEWIAGDIVLDKDAVAKISGTIEGDVNVTYGGAAGGSAKVIVEAGDAKSLTIADGCSLTIKANIDVEINGKVIGEDVADSKLDVQAAKSVVINSGAVIDKVKFDNSDKAVTVYSGADINTSNFTAFSLITGKDAASGTWEVSGTTLKLNNYNGTYNFGGFAATLTAIDLTGTNVVSYAFNENFADAAVKMFGNATITSITTETSGSLDINIDLSSIDKTQLFKTGTLTVISAGALEINGVDVSVTVSGQNAAWAAEDTKAAQIVGISSGALEAYNANIVVDVFSAYTSATAAKVIAISSAAATLDNAKTIDIKSAGTAIKATGNVIVSNARTLVSIDGKKAGIDAGENALQFKSSSSADVDVKGGVKAGAFTVMETEVNIAGTSSVASINESNTSSVSFTDKVTVTGAIGITQGSSLALKDAVLSGAMTNGGTVSITGNAIVFGGITNNATLTNDGTIGLYGTFANTSTFINNGTFVVLGKEYNTAGITPLAPLANAITFTDAAAADGKVKITAINLTEIVPNVNGSASIKATVTLSPDTAIKDSTFAGTLTPSQSGTGYVLALANQTASITVTFSEVDAGVAQVGSNFTASVSGYVVANDDSTVYLDTYTVKTTTVDGAAVNDAVLVAKIVDSAAAFTTTAGKVTSTGSFTIYSPATATIAGEFEGDIVANIATKLNINGKFTGNITSDGAADVAVTKKMVGDITAIGAVSSTVDLTGNIVSGGDVTIDKKFDGNVTMKTADKTFSVTGTATGTLTFTAEYKATKDATTKTESTATVDFSTAATTGAVAIITVAGADATAETAMKEVSLKFGAITALGTDKTASIKATSGIFGIPENKVLVTGYELVIEAGATIEVAKAAQLDVTASALKVSKDAVKNFEVGTAPAVTYGKVVSIMSFDIDGGAYTIYSNVAYALSNCDENADINVLVSDTISEGVKVKTGVNVIVGDGVTLTFGGKNVEMESGAKISIVGTGKVVFAASGDNTLDPELEAGDSFEYYSVSGTIVFGDNAVEFDGVRFTAESTVVGVAATETVPAKISTTLLYNEGTATIAAGVGTGFITLGNGDYLLVKGDDESKELVYATFIVGEGAVFDAVAINDTFARVNYDDDGEIEEYTAYPTTVEINGILNLSANTTANGVWSGLGKVTLPENKTFTLAQYDAPAGLNKTVGSVASFVLVDTTEDENGYALEFVTASHEAALTFTAKKVKLDGEDYYAMTVGGVLGFGAIKATTAAVIDQLTIKEDAGVVADTTFLLKDKNSTARGYLMTNDIYMKADGVTAYGALDYEVTFEQEGYTVYTYFASVDFEEITDITIEKDGFVFANGQVIEGDVTITIMDGVFAQVPAGGKLIIGEAATTLGAGAPVIVGSIWIPTNSYMIVYPNADITGAEILSEDKTTAAITSKFDIEGTLYATAYASKTAATTKTLANAAADLVPEITGYTFTSWKPYNDGGMGQLIGVCDVTATLVAQKVIVKATFLEGVQYYCNGVLYDAVGIDNKVTVGSIFTAKIVDYSKYQGTPLVNGQNAFEVTENVTLTVTGVSPVEPTPEPEPAGMSLTEILLIVLVVLIAIMVVIIALRLNRS